jgi:toxin ParE1/3/4
MVRVVLTVAADADIEAIFQRLNTRAGLSTAAKYRALFARLYERLSQYPDGCQRRRALGPNIRVCVVAPYVVIYRYIAGTDVVTVLRIRHGRRRTTTKSLPD